MVQKLGNLALILERMMLLYVRVAEVMDREKDLLIKLEFESLYIVLAEKDEVLQAIRALDRDRLRIQDQFAIVFGCKSSEVTLLTLAERILSQGVGAEAPAKRLLVLRQELNSTVEILRQKIERNRRFIEKSVESMRALAENLSQNITGRDPKQKKQNTYTGKAKFQEVKEQTGTLVEKRL